MIVDEDRRVSQSQLRNEIQRRLDILGYDACRMHQYLLSPKDPVTLTRDLVLYFDAADLGPEGDETMIIQNIETNYGVKVYAAITTQCGELYRRKQSRMAARKRRFGSKNANCVCPKSDISRAIGMGYSYVEDARWDCGKDWVEWTRLLISGMIFSHNFQSDLISISNRQSLS